MKWKDKLIEVFLTLECAGEVIGVTKGAVSQWKHGVPAKHLDKIIEAAKERGYTLTQKQLRSKK